MLPGAGARLVDHLEEVAIHRFTKEKSLEGRSPERLDQLRPVLAQALLESFELRERIEDRHMSAELLLERRHLEPFDIEYVHLLAASDVQPHRFARDIVWNGSRR